MAGSSSSSPSSQDLQLAESLLFTSNHRNKSEFDEIVFEKRPLRLQEIQENPQHKLALENWTQELEGSERKLERKLANLSTCKSDLYQILGLFFVFQGVIITAVAQSSQLRCNNWWLVFALSLVAFLATVGATVQKLAEMAEYEEQHLLEKKVYSSLRTTIDDLKERGLEFDLQKDQPELAKGYTQEDNFGEGSFARWYAKLMSFWRVWVWSYAGSVLLVLFAFSVITLVAVPRILCS